MTRSYSNVHDSENCCDILRGHVEAFFDFVRPSRQRPCKEVQMMTMDDQNNVDRTSSLESISSDGSVNIMRSDSLSSSPDKEWNYCTGDDEEVTAHRARASHGGMAPRL